MRRRNGHRGFWLIELLMAIILLAVFGLVAGRLFHTTVLLSYHESDAQNAVASFESAMNALRADVWTAKSMDADDLTTLGITVSDRTIRWHVNGTEISRSAGNVIDRWTVPEGLALTIDGPSVVVEVPKRGQLRLNNQVRLVARLMR